MMAEMGTPFGVFPVGIDGGALAGGSGEAAVGMGGGRRSLPIRGSSGCRASRCSSAGGLSVMPSHQTPPSGVRATLVKMVFLARVAMALGLVLARGAGGYAEEAGFGVDGAELAGGVGLDPGDVVADGPDLPAVEAFGRDQHGEVGLAAGGGEGGGDVGLFVCLLVGGDSTPRMSMCSAIQPSSRAMLEAMRRAKHFLPSSALPP